MKEIEKILAQYYDDELNDAKRSEVRALISSSPENANALKNLEAMSDFFQIMKEENLEKVSFDGFDKRVINEIHKNEKPVPLGEKINVWFREFFSHRKIVWIPAASVAGAACAALLVVGVQSASPVAPIMPESGSSETWQASATTPSSGAMISVTAPDSIEVEQFDLETDGGQQIAVVWINE